MEFTDNLREADNDFDDALSVANTKEELISNKQRKACKNTFLFH